MTILALDQGTTSTRALSVDPAGQVRPLLSLPHAQHYPAPGHVEHDPEELITNLRACLAAAPADCQAVGLANQGESCLGWDARSGEAVGPVIVWQDDRTAPDTERLRADGAEGLVRDRAGLPLDPYFSAGKLGWILRNVPRARELAAAGHLRLGTTDAFFRQRLTGSCATDVTTASRTSLMNLRTCQWDAELCALFGVPMACLPPIAASTGDLGRIGALPLTASAVDQQAALYGHGCRSPGDAKITFGTGAFALAVTGPLVAGAGGALPTVAWALAGEAPTYALDGGVYAAASAVNWARGLGLFADWPEIDDFAAPPAVSRGLTFVPALAGLACPHWDRAARGAWMGLGLETTPKDMMQALLEGVAFRMAEVVATMDAAVPIAAPVSVDGGMAANGWFCQFLADALGRDVLVAAEREQTALGIAALAAAGAGLALDLPRQGRLLRPRPQPAAWAERFAAARAAVQGYGRAVARD